MFRRMSLQLFRVEVATSVPRPALLFHDQDKNLSNLMIRLGFKIASLPLATNIVSTAHTYTKLDHLSIHNNVA